MKYPFLDLAVINAPYADRLKQAAARVIDSGRYIGGDEVSRLEDAMTRLTGARHAIGVGSGLDALRLILRGYMELGRLRPGDGVIVPDNTFIASVLAITDNQLKPVLVNANPLTANIDADALREGVAMGAKAVMPVHLYGRIAWDEAMEGICRDAGLIVVEDAAQAIGAGIPGGRRAGAIGDAAGFSFYPTKNVGALGDAGVVTTSDADLAEVVRSLHNYGTAGHYRNIYAGSNSRLDPIQAAMIMVKLPSVDAENAYRRSIAKVYDEGIVNPLIAKPIFVDDDSVVWHQYVVRVDDREHFQAYAASRGVETSSHYPLAIHQQPCYSGYAEPRLEPSESLCASVVSLPITHCTSVEDAREIAGILNSYSRVCGG